MHARAGVNRWCQTSHAAQVPVLNAEACLRRVSGLYSVWLTYFVLCCDPCVTADWRLGAAVPSSLISQPKLLRYTETGGIVPGDTHPASPVTGSLPFCLPPSFPASCQPVAPSLARIHPASKLFSASFWHPLVRNVKVLHGKQLFWARTGIWFTSWVLSIVPVQLAKNKLVKNCEVFWH